jgi:hypothetical protein
MMDAASKMDSITTSAEIFITYNLSSFSCKQFVVFVWQEHAVELSIEAVP